MRRAARRDVVESSLVAIAEALGAVWIQGPPFDGWLFFRGRWHLCEVKDPCKEGWKDEFTTEQLKTIIRLNERQVPWHVLRTEDDVLSLLDAQRTA